MRDQYSAPRAAGTTFRFQLDLATPAGGWGRDRLNLLQAKARELAPDRHALYAPAMPGLLLVYVPPCATPCTMIDMISFLPPNAAIG